MATEYRQGSSETKSMSNHTRDKRNALQAKLGGNMATQAIPPNGGVDLNRESSPRLPRDRTRKHGTSNTNHQRSAKCRDEEHQDEVAEIDARRRS